VIPKSFIQDLLNRLDIVDVIERYVPLKKPAPTIRPAVRFTTKNLRHLPSVRASSFIIASVAACMAPPSVL